MLKIYHGAFELNGFSIALCGNKQSHKGRRQVICFTSTYMHILKEKWRGSKTFLVNFLSAIAFFVMCKKKKKDQPTLTVNLLHP